MMKKLIIPLVCLLGFTAAHADEFKMTTLVNYPIGIYDKMTVSGSAVFNNTVEIGTRDMFSNITGATAIPVNQTQNIMVFGPVELSHASGPFIEIDGNLQLGGREWPNTSELPEANYNFNSIYVTADNGFYSGGIMKMNTLNAGTVMVLNNFTDDSAGILDVTSVVAERILVGGKEIPKPTGLGRVGVWASPISDPGGSRGGDVYGPWSRPAEIAGSDTCDGNDINNEFSCPDNLPCDTETEDCTNHYEPHTCVDVRRITGMSGYYSAVGGAYVMELRYREECTFYQDSSSRDNGCEFNPVLQGDKSGYLRATTNKTYATYPGGSQAISFKVPEQNNPPITTSQIDAAIDSGNFGPLCYKVCDTPNGCGGGPHYRLITADSGGGPEKIKQTYSKQTESGESTPQRGANYDSSDVGCRRTFWPAGSGLECTNAWNEYTTRVLVCNPKSGKLENAVGQNGAAYQFRRVSCSNKSESSSASGRYLTLRY